MITAILYFILAFLHMGTILSMVSDYQSRITRKEVIGMAIMSLLFPVFWLVMAFYWIKNLFKH